MARVREHEKWTRIEENKLRKLANTDTPTPIIAKKLQRTESAIYSKASEIKKSLLPKD